MPMSVGWKRVGSSHFIWVSFDRTHVGLTGTGAVY